MTDLARAGAHINLRFIRALDKLYELDVVISRLTDDVESLAEPDRNYVVEIRLAIERARKTLEAAESMVLSLERVLAGAEGRGALRYDILRSGFTEAGIAQTQQNLKEIT